MGRGTGGSSPKPKVAPVVATTTATSSEAVASSTEAIASTTDTVVDDVETADTSDEDIDVVTELESL